MSIDMRKHDHEERNVMDFTTWVSLTFVALMMFAVTRPAPRISPQVSLFMPTCVGMSSNPNTPRETVTINVDFDDTLLWNNTVVSQAQFENNLNSLWANHNSMVFVLNMNPLASNKASFDTLHKMQAHQKEYVVLTKDFALL
jgi:biopolymer transport protein ExbD